MATVLKAGNSTTPGSFTPDNTGVLQLKTGSGAGSVALSIDANQKVILPSTTLTTASVGMFEYDGKIPYFTPQGVQRGAVPAAQFFRLDSGLAGANVNTVQSVFGVGVTLTSSIVYAFEAAYVFNKSAGTTTHNISLGFGGTATVNNVLYELAYISYAGGPTGGAAGNFGAIATVASTTVQSVGAVAAVTAIMLIKGTVSVNAGGTFIPQYTLSAAPGGAYTTVAGSYFNIYPLGASGANINVGTWA